MSVNVLEPIGILAKNKSLGFPNKLQNIGHPSCHHYSVRTHLGNSIFDFISNVSRSFPEDDFVIRSITIKGDKVQIQYQTESSATECPELLNDEIPVTFNQVRILNLGSGQFSECLHKVYQVKTAVA